MYYLVGIKYDSPRKEYYREFLAGVLNELQWSLNGRVFINYGESLLNSEGFNKILQHGHANDTLIFYNTEHSFSTPDEYLHFITQMIGHGFNMVDLTYSRLNNIDYMFLYEELFELVTLMKCYMDFLYRLHSNDFNIPWDSYPVVYYVDKEFNQFVQDFLHNTSKRYNFFDDPLYYFSRFTLDQSRNYLTQVLPSCANLPFDIDYKSLQALADVRTNNRTST